MKQPFSTVNLVLLLSVLIGAVSAPSLAAVPLRWTVETSRVQPAQFDAYHGEELALEAALQSYGKPLAIPPNADVRLFWQTNGMGNVYWSTNATLVSSNRLSAAFLPTYDPGVTVVNGFIGVPSSNYRASFTLRFRGSPGATPFSPPPIPSHDYYTKSETDAKIIELSPAPGNYFAVSNNAMTAVQPSDITDMETKTHAREAYQTKLTSGTTIKTINNQSILGSGNIIIEGGSGSGMPSTGLVYSADQRIKTYDGAHTISASNIGALDANDTSVVKGTYDSSFSGWNINVAFANTASVAQYASFVEWQNIQDRPSTLQGYGITDAASSSDLSTHAAQAANAYYPKSQGDAWSTYWDGDDVRVTVTNYDSSVNLPSLYLEQRTNEVSQATNHFRTVWREMAHWERFLGTNWNWNAQWSGFLNWRNTVNGELGNKADRAWGFYDSSTGNYSPDSYTSISSSNILIASGMSYQKTITSSAEVWILTANEPYEPTGVSTNGGFQIKDSDGNIQFEIVKGDKVTVAAQANVVTVDQTAAPNTLVVTYNIIANQHPTAEVCLDLANPVWKAEGSSGCPATVIWSGSSGAYVARITPTQETSKCFVKATYQRGGDTYINNRCAVGMSQIVLNGTTYNLGTAIISGNTVLTLTPAN